jgi:predicted ABC-type transport system involved in lysophospholipase L1 biosynthesis ATPase subunit
MLAARRLAKDYSSGTHTLTVLRDVSFHASAGSFVAIVGPSGSGKTTLLGLLAGLDTPTRGEVILDGQNLSNLNEDARARVRGEKVGFIFQSFQLIPTLTALENVQVPLELRGEPDAARRAHDLLTRMGLEGRTGHLPTQLSGGEQQRVAIAVALANRPQVILADEPTGELDSEGSEQVFEALRGVNRELGVTAVIVTHDPAVSEQVDRTVGIRDGRTSSETLRREASDGRIIAQEYAVLDRAGRLQLPRDFMNTLHLRRRVRLELERDHIGVWPDRGEDDRDE